MRKRNAITALLRNERNGQTVKGFASLNNLNKNSVSATFLGTSPVKKIVLFLYLNEREIYNLLPENSKEKINTLEIDAIEEMKKKRKLESKKTA